MKYKNFDEIEVEVAAPVQKSRPSDQKGIDFFLQRKQANKSDKVVNL
jgi:hypothetical protein